jgi:ADP-ribose pyrophosphatase YjhB (NUDIX family)
VLLRDAEGRILLVRPTYKPGWDLPGGMAEANESPDDAARRELQEELGLAVVLHGLLVVDWVGPHGPWDDQLAFVFDGGVLAADDVPRPRDGELAEARFVAGDEAAALVGAHLGRRLAAAVRAQQEGRPVFLREGAAGSAG